MLAKKWQYIFGFYVIFLLVVFRLTLVPAPPSAVDIKPPSVVVPGTPRSHEDGLGFELGRREQAFLTSAINTLRQIMSSRTSLDAFDPSADKPKPARVDDLENYLHQLFKWAE